MSGRRMSTSTKLAISVAMAITGACLLLIAGAGVLAGVPLPVPDLTSCPGGGASLAPGAPAEHESETADA